MKNDVPNLSHLSLQLLDTVSEAYDTLFRILYDESDNNIYCEEDLARLVAVWKLQLILDARICGVEDELFPMDKETGYWRNYGNLHAYVDQFHKSCLFKLGFELVEYEFGYDDQEESNFGLFDSDHTRSFVEAVFDGKVFDENTVYLTDLMNFVIATDGCTGISYMCIKLFKSAYFGNLFEQAKRRGMEQEVSFVSMSLNLESAFGFNGVFDNQSGCGVTDGVYYAYLVFYDVMDGEGENFTWVDIRSDMIWYVARAYCYARQFEQQLKAMDKKKSA